MFYRLKGFLFIPLSVFIAVIVMPSIALSGLIWPLKIGDTYKFFFEEPGEESGYEYSLVAEKVNINSTDYFYVPEIDPVSGDIIPGGEDTYLRSTEDAIYQCDPDGNEGILFQLGSVGTKWHNYPDPDEGDEVYRHCFYEIVDDNATVNFKFGHEPLTGAYQIRVDCCSDFEQTNCSPSYTDFWIVPNVGYVKAVEMPDQGGTYLYWFELLEIISADNSKVITPGVPLLLLDD